MVKSKLRDHRLYIEDILESINKIEKYTKGMSFEKFSKDEKTIDAVVRNFEIIGEATRQLDSGIKKKYSDIEWKSMIAFRNVIAHEYFGIDMEIMWDIIQTNIPPLKQKIQNLLQILSKKRIN